MSIETTAHASERLNGHITLEVAIRFPDNGKIWSPESVTADGKPTEPLRSLLPIAIHGGGELIARYPGETQWQRLTFKTA